MRSRYLLIALPLLAIAATPVAAQDVVFVPGTGEVFPVDAAEDHSVAIGETTESDMMAMADKMADPAVQSGVAAVVERTADAMMNLPVGRFAEAIERARPGTVSRKMRGDATVADLTGRDARYLPEELGERSREAMGMMSGFARAMAVMMPEFERMGREMEESFRAAKAEARRNQN